MCEKVEGIRNKSRVSYNEAVNVGEVFLRANFISLMKGMN